MTFDTLTILNMENYLQTCNTFAVVKAALKETLKSKKPPKTFPFYAFSRLSNRYTTRL